VPGKQASTVRGVAAAAHIGPSVLIAAIMTALALHPGVGAARLVVFASAALLGQFSIGWSNDYVDAPHDTAAGRRDKPVVAGGVSRRAIGIAALGALVANVVLCFTLTPRTGVVNLVMMAAGWAYNAGLKSTALSGVTYVVGFGLIPAFAFSVRPGSPAPPAWLVVAAALLGGGAHFANVLPDLDDDAATGVRGLPHRLGAAGSQIAAAVLLLAATLTLVFGPAGPPSWAGLAAAVAALVVLPLGWYAAQRARGRPVAMFRAVIVVALIDILLLIFSGRVV